MPTKTSQLQIRVTEAEKAALKRLARAANLSVSRYVLEQALPSRQGELERVIGTLAEGRAGGGALDELQELIALTPADDFHERLGRPPIERLGPVLQNQLAAMIEQTAATKGIDPPDWVGDVPPLSRPHFAWSLRSLQPHQIRVTPVPYKRRGIFFDPATRPPLTAAARTSDPAALPEDALERLASFNAFLVSSELKVEFYYLGGAVLSQAFQARPPTAHVAALFRAPGEVADAASRLGEREGWPGSWVQDSVKEVLYAGLRPERYLDLPNLAVFVPQPEYVLALKVAALRLDVGGRAVDDLRYVLRALNVGTPDAALEIAGRYFGPRQLSPDARDVLAGLLAHRAEEP